MALAEDPDGVFGSGTESSLKVFEALHGLVEDGIGGYER
ncbi:peptidoglycan-binding protein [Enterobacter ludwigii]